MPLGLVASPILWNPCWGQRASEATGTLDSHRCDQKGCCLPGVLGIHLHLGGRAPPVETHRSLLVREILMPYLTSGPLFPKESRSIHWDLTAGV